MTHTLLAGLAAGLALTANAAAQNAEQTFSHTGFDRIDISGQFEARIEVGETWSVQMSGDADDMDDVRIGTEDGELRVRARNRWFGNGGDLDVTLVVTMPDIAAAEFGRGISADLSGVNAGQFDLEVSTGASATISGQCTRLEAEVSTGGLMRARALECGTVAVEASTGGSGDVYASDRVDAEASTGGELDIFGSPRSHSRETSFGGSIRIVSGS
ncbi:GIN domain-containing protein [Hyphobacterium marinum]|uniref:DUF2807 domain-containing protein n=1 Tax=Hyphobacterium marinum TaxID=3116574 RepID=A0ABU7M114_9PROT|nr:DUF2807 domain-containing protein [Hyphobacterium sp. Y6023]MEE2567509.1 DUF2807 domain-containing protein [Hyphobacterium sp. Y6023]